MKKQVFHSGDYARRQSGVSLVEVLVTVLILAVGSLGVASLQLAGLKYSSGSYARTQVVILSDDMANRIKSNLVFALNENNNGTFGDSPYEMPDFTDSLTVNRDCIVTTCNQQELADYDLASWIGEIARTVPSGQGRITVLDIVGANGVSNRQFSIEVQWRQVANSTNPDANDNDEIRSTAYRISL